MHEVKLTPIHGTLVEKNDIPLPVLADRIRELLKEITVKAGPLVFEVGNLFRVARLDFPSDHGFGVWVSENFSDWPIRTIYNYYQLADKFYQRQELVKIIPQSGLYLLAHPQCEEFREDLVEEFQAEDDKVSYKHVQEAIKSRLPKKEKSEDEDVKAKKYALNNAQITVIWKAIGIAAMGASESDLMLHLQVKEILGTPVETDAEY